MAQWDTHCCEYGHSSYCPTITLERGDEVERLDMTKNSVELPLTGSVIRDALGVFNLIRTRSPSPNNYATVNSLICMGHPLADVGANRWIQVQVFPEMELKGDSHDRLFPREREDQGREEKLRYKPEATWGFGGELEGKYGNNSFKGGFDSKTDSDRLPFVGPLLKSMGWLSTICDSMANYGADVTVKGRWPNWTIGAAGLEPGRAQGEADRRPRRELQVRIRPAVRHRAQD